MPTSRLNSRFALRSVLAALGLGLVVFALHFLQMKRHAAEQLERAEEASESEDTDEFLASLDRYLHFDPRNKEVRTRYALTLADKAKGTRDRWKALQVLRRVMAEAPELSAVRLQAVELALALREPDQAAKYLEPLLRAEPGRAELHVVAARCELARNKVTGAAASLTRALELAPEQVETAEMLAGIYRDRLRSPLQAQATLDRLVEANPTLPAAHLARAKYALRDQRYDSAAADLAVAAKLAPHDIEVAQTHAEVETRRGNFDRAIDLWKRAIALAPDRVPPHVSLAMVARERGETGVALDALRQARKLAPDRLDLVFDLGDLLVEVGKIAEGREIQKQLAKAAPGQADFLLGKVAQHERRWLDAVNAYIASLQAPDTKSELAGRAYFEMSRCYAALGGRVEEMQALESAVRLSPAAQPRLVLAQRLVQARRFQDAIPWLREATGQKVAPPTAWGLLARALVEQNRLLPPPRRHWLEVENAIDRARAEPDQAVSLALVEADMALLRDKVDQALAILAAASKLHPDQPAFYLAMAEIAARERDPAKVEAALGRGDKALKDRMDWLWLRIDRLTARRDEGAYSELARLVSRVETLSSRKREQLERHLVEVHMQMGNHGDVERLCTQLLIYHGNDAQVRLWLIESLLAQNDLGEAKRHLADLRKLEGEKGLGWRCATAELLLYQSGPGEKARLDEARGLVAFALEARPNWSQPIFLRARLDDKEGKTDSALAGYRRLLELGDYRPLALNRVLEILDGKKQWADAFAVCELAMQQGALDRGLQRVAANLALKTNQKARAQDIAVLLVPESNSDYRDHIWLGNLLDAAARPGAAGDAFERALELAPDGAEPYLALMVHYVRNRRSYEAEDVLDRMKATLDGQRGALAVARGYEILARPDLAESAYREILKGKPYDPAALRRLAALLIRYDKNRLAEPVLLRLLGPRVPTPDEAVPELRRRLALVIAAPEQKKDRVDEALRLLDLNEPREEDASDARTRALVRGRRSLQALEALPTEGMGLQERRRLAQLYDADNDGKRSRAILLDLLQKDPVNTGTISALLESLYRDKRRVEGLEWIDRLEKLEPRSERVAEFRRRWEKLDRAAGK